MKSIFQFQLLQKVVVYYQREIDQSRPFYSIHVVPEMTLQTHSALLTLLLHLCIHVAPLFSQDLWLRGPCVYFVGNETAYHQDIS